MRKHYRLALSLSCSLVFNAGCYEVDRSSDRASDQGPIAVAASDLAAPIRITEDSSLQGYLDVADCTGIYGWAYDTDAAGHRVDVNIYDGNTKIATVKAGGFRQDLADAGKDDGSVMFGFPLPDSLKDSRDHQIQVIIENGRSLTPNPITITCNGP